MRPSLTLLASLCKTAQQAAFFWRLSFNDVTKGNNTASLLVRHLPCYVAPLQTCTRDTKASALEGGYDRAFLLETANRGLRFGRIFFFTLNNFF